MSEMQGSIEPGGAVLHLMWRFAAKSSVRPVWSIPAGGGKILHGVWGTCLLGGERHRRHPACGRHIGA
jgi:hypothetical protein